MNVRNVNSNKQKQTKLRLDINEWRYIDNFRTIHDLPKEKYSDQYVIKQMLLFIDIFNNMAEMVKEDPSMLSVLKKHQDKTKYMEILYDNCDRYELEKIYKASGELLEKIHMRDITRYR